MTQAFQLFGGIGLFLLGMSLMTDGLKAAAGEALQKALVRFTGTPFKAFLSGTAATLMVQSSSATTVTLIGFVSAGLLAFPQAVGFVFGASLGATGTGWIIASLGLKISLGFYALPLMGVGAFLNLLGRGRRKALGIALAGFALIFLGIDTLKEAMDVYSGQFDLGRLGDSPFVPLLLGLVFTLVLQSSGAAVATTLTALHTGAISFGQAMPMVIGASIGTTITGLLAAIGASVPAKRTAWAHVIFNLATGLLALALMPWFLRALLWAQVHLGLEPGAYSLVSFHSAFILVGVFLFLPWVRHFSAAIERLLPDRGPPLTRHLDKALLATPAVALEATRRALLDTASSLLRQIRGILRGEFDPAAETRLAEIQAAIAVIENFLALIPAQMTDAPLSTQRLAQMHAIDHLIRLHERQRLAPASRRRLAEAPFEPARDLAAALLEHGLALTAGSLAGTDSPEALSKDLAHLRRQQRIDVLQQTAEGSHKPTEALEKLDAMRWLDQIGYHTWRLSHYLAPTGEP